MIYIIHHNYFLIDDLKNNYIDKNIRFIEVSYKRLDGYFLRLLRKIHFKSQIPKKEIWLDLKNISKNNIITKDDKVIFFDTMSLAYLDLAKRLNHQKTAIFWCWNKIRDNEKEDLNILVKKNKNIFSFDKKDCEIYNIKYMNQFYWRESKSKDRIELGSKILFVGQDKGRINKILKFAELGFQELDLYLLKDKTSKVKYNNYYSEKVLSYEQTLEKIKKSKCLLEIVVEGQEGITIRTLEAIFYKKKLITNNESIKNYDFYNENNIFILNSNMENVNLQIISKFLKSEYQNIEKKILEKYEFKNWLIKILKESKDH